jgi:hypothetical protein
VLHLHPSKLSWFSNTKRNFSSLNNLRTIKTTTNFETSEWSVYWRRIHGSSIGIESRLRIGRLGFSSRRAQGWKFFSSPLRPDRLWGPPTLLPNRYWVLTPGRKADNSPPSSDEVKNAWRYASTPPIHLHGVVLIGAGDTSSFHGVQLSKGTTLLLPPIEVHYSTERSTKTWSSKNLPLC